MATILIVDDRSTNRELLVTLLGYAGHRLLEAAEGEQGLALARAEHPDLIITDIVMPKMDGYEFAHQVRADPSINNTQIIFYTSSYIVSETRRLAEACGVSIVIGKPIEPAEFLEQVRIALASKQAPVAPPVAENFHREHMRVLTDSLVNKVEELEAEIVERKRAEDRFKLAIEAAPNAIIMVDEHGQIILVNSMAEKYFGYERKELIAQSVDKLVPLRFHGRHPHQREEFLSDPQTRSMGDGRDLYGLRKDGSEFPVEIGLAPIKTQLGMLVLATIVDITERKQAEQVLRESEERFRQVWESTSDAMCISDASGLILAANPASFRLYGYTPEQIIGQSITVTVPEENREQLMEQYRTVFLSDFIPPTFETVARHADGTDRVVESSITFLTNAAGERTAMLSTFHDITERKKGQEALAESERHYRQIIETAHEGVWTIDPDNRTTFVNQRLADMLGYSQEEMMGRLVFDFMDADGQAIAMKSLELRRQGIDQQLDFKYIRKDGSVLWALIETSSLLDRDGKYIGALAMLTDITDRKGAEQHIHLQLERLQALRTIDIAISSSVDLRLTFEVILSQVVGLLNTDAAAVLLFNPITSTLEYAASRGFRSTALRQAKVRLGSSHAGRAILERRTIHTPNLLEPDDEIKQALTLNNEGFVDYYCVPLLAKGEVKGALEIFHRSLMVEDPEWLDFLETLGGQTAIAIDNSQLFEGLQKSNTDLTLAYDATIEGWSAALDLRDKETEGHSQRVTEMTLEMARAMGMGEAELIHVRRGALLHDIGKLGVPDHILLKPGKLTDEEWVIMRKHPTYAYEMLAKITYLKPALDIPYTHHEKWDGSGYPRGLKGGQIALAARIFAIVDVWDALTSDRPYRAAWSKEKALEFIKSESGKHFDPQVVEGFARLIAGK